ncbi:MAG TPA: hypothetical protein VN780_08540 [Candidatus Eisenbacteria bacterium]|jgi:hypothetical protein|nr:hypothetical protein [Candidatus Eisenbacteria bacterium]
MQKRFQFLTLLAMVAMTAALATAHGDKKHIVGTLETVNSDSVVVKTADGKSVEVKLVANTVYVSRDGKTSKQSDLAVGERVVIHATPIGDTLAADEVKFSPPGTAPAASTKPKS